MIAQRLHGIIPPVCTPLTKDLNIDLKHLEKLIVHLIEGGVHGLFLLGTTGEGAALTIEQKKQVIKHSVQFAKNRLPVLVNVTDTVPKVSIAISQFAKEAGADAIVLAPPYYFPSTEQDLLDYFEYLIPQLALPLVLYNIPSHTKSSITLEMAVRLAKIPQVIGIKESSGDMTLFHNLIQHINAPNYSFLVGPEILLGECLLAGGHGGVPGGANIYPRLFSNLYEAAQQEDLELIQLYQSVIRTLYQKVYTFGSYGTGFIKGTKAILAIKGICQPYMIPPSKHYGEEALEQMQGVIENLEEAFPFLKL